MHVPFTTGRVSATEVSAKEKELRASDNRRGGVRPCTSVARPDRDWRYIGNGGARRKLDPSRPQLVRLNQHGQDLELRASSARPGKRTSSLATESIVRLPSANRNPSWF